MYQITVKNCYHKNIKLKKSSYESYLDSNLGPVRLAGSKGSRAQLM